MANTPLVAQLVQEYAWEQFEPRVGRLLCFLQLVGDEKGERQRQMQRQSVCSGAIVIIL